MSYTRHLITRIVAECPHRAPASAGEFKAQEILAAEMNAEEASVAFRPCRFNTCHYTVVALHFAMAALGGVLLWFGPAAALACHLFAAVSYWGDSQKRFFLLRRLLPRSLAQNLVVTYPARTTVRRRIVVLGHADAAPTGWIFLPSLVRFCNERFYGRAFRFLRKPMLTAMLVLALVILQDVQLLFVGWLSWWLVGGYALAHVYFLAIALLNLQVALSRTVVDGANDNLTACAAVAVLAQRYAPLRPDDVELVFVVTAGEETCNGGALALAKEMRGQWARSKTVVLALECLGGGELRVLQDGELFSRRVPNWLMKAVDRAANAEGLTPLNLYQLPAGWTDVYPFLTHGYDGLCIIRVDPQTGVPTNYHLPSDRPENIDYRELAEAIRFVERFLDEVSALPPAAKQI